MVKAPPQKDVMSEPVRKSALDPADAGARYGVVQRRLNKRGRRMLANVNPMGWFLLDCAIAFFAMTFGFAITPHVVILDQELSSLFVSASFALLVGLISHIAGLHDPRYPRDSLNSLFRVMAVVVLATMLLLVEVGIIYYAQIGRYIVGSAVLVCTTLMFGLRRVIGHYSRNFGQTICFLGDDAFCYRATQFVDEHKKKYCLVSYTDDPPDSSSDDLFDEWCIDNEVDEVIFDASLPVNDERLLECLDEGIKVSTYSDFVEENYFLVPVEHIDARWLFMARLDLAHPYYHGVKRMVDVGASIVGLILSSPLLLLAMAAIKLESRGPMFYSQLRVGRFNRPFYIYKLRTMVQDAEKNGAQWAQTSDSRITRTGKILRKTRIDEIPQFWNVLKGEMSLVGPRPERPEFVEMLKEELPFYVQRHLVKPGLTGWAQINYPYGASVEDALNKLTYDLFYVKRTSVGLDLQIMLRTIGAMMKGSR